MSAQTSLFDPPVAQVRRTDPRPSKQAAALDTVERAEQWKCLLRRLHDGPISADTAGELIGRHRSIASTRLGVLCKRGLAEPAGEHRELGRKVLRYRLTPAGEREFAQLFGAVS